MYTEITAENINEIYSRLQFLNKKFKIDFEENGELKIGDTTIFIGFYKDEVEMKISDFFMYTDNVESICKVDESTVRSEMIRQTIVDSYNINYLITQNIYFETDILSLKFINKPFYIGLIAEKEGKYDKHMGIYPCSIYDAVELIYKNTQNRLTNKEEDILIKQFLFSITVDHNIHVKISEFIEVPEYNWEEDEKKEAININYHDRLILYSPAMDMYSEALGVHNEEVKYLYFYKILEYFSPIVSKKKSYELLNQKLDALPVIKRDHRYLESIFNLTRKYDLSLRDKELTNTVLKECIDIVEIYNYLPYSMQKSLSNTYQFTNIEIIDNDKKENIIRKIGNILYSTRNNYVHAKSNYNLTGDECKNEELTQLNIFMEKLCYCLIIWNSRQSDQYRM